LICKRNHTLVYVTKCPKANISVTDYCWLETIGHLFQISLNDYSSLPGFVKDQHGGQRPLIGYHDDHDI